MIALIPARGGSKAIPKKNISNVAGFPLLAYSIAAAKLSKKIDRVVVSTDSEEIAEVAKKFGAEIPFMRPAELASDTAIDIDVLGHAAGWFEQNEKKLPEYMVYLRPTTPLRDPALIDEAITNLLNNAEATSLRSAHETQEPPHKSFRITDGYFTGLFPNETRKDYYDLPRQAFPTVYDPNGYVDIVIPEQFRKNQSCFGNKILAFITPVVTEIDRAENLDYLRNTLEKSNHLLFEYLRANFSPSH